MKDLITLDHPAVVPGIDPAQAIDIQIEPRQLLSGKTATAAADAGKNNQRVVIVTVLFYRCKHTTNQ